MDRRAASFLFLGVVVGALLASVVFIQVSRRNQLATGDGERQVVLKLGHVLDQAHPVHISMEYMAKRTAELSNGRVRIEIFPNGQLGSEPECIEQLQRGALALVKTSVAAMEGFVPDMAVFGLPYLFRDDDHYWKVLDGPIGRELLKAGEPVGVYGLCYYESGTRSFYTVSRPILTPADVRELKLRVLPSKMARDFVSLLGGGPTPIPFGELYTALQQSMVDGAENNPPSVLTSRHYEVAKHYSLNEHTRVADMIIASAKIWNELPPEVRAWVQQAADESAAFQRTLWKEKTEEALTVLAKAGVQIYRPEKEPFRKAAQPMYDALETTRIGTLARQIELVR